MGGDCLNSGCVPSKALIRAAHAAANVRDAGQFGVCIADGGYSVDFGKVMERMRKLRAGISAHDSAKRFSDLGVDVFLGQATFVGNRTVRVGDHALEFSRACIATGTRAGIPPIPGIGQARPLTNETVFTLTELPRRLAVIGGGPIGVEMSQSFARFGSQVTLIEGTGGILIREDRDAAEIVERSLQRDGVNILFNNFATGVTVEGDESVIRAESQVDGTVTEIRADRVLVAAGRVPNTEDLGLAKAGVKYDKRVGVLVDDRLRNLQQANLRRRGCLLEVQVHPHGGRHRPHRDRECAVLRSVQGGVPSRSLGVPIRIRSWPTSGLAKTGRAGRTFPSTPTGRISQPWTGPCWTARREGFVKIHCKRGTDTILGATIVARHAGEMISEVTTAMTGGIGPAVDRRHDPSVPDAGGSHPQDRGRLPTDEADPRREAASADDPSPAQVIVRQRDATARRRGPRGIRSRSSSRPSTRRNASVRRSGGSETAAWTR